MRTCILYEQMYSKYYRVKKETDRTRPAAPDSPRGPAPKHFRLAIYTRNRIVFHSQRERHWQCREVTAQHSFTASPGPAGSKKSDETSR